MAETLFDRAERGLGSADLSVPDIVAKTKGNPQEIMKLVMGGQINLTQALLAKRLSDSIKSDPGAAQQPTVLQEQFPQLAQATGAAPPMPQGGGLGAMPPQAMPPQMGPQGMPPQGGGIGGLDFAAAPMAQGGIVGYQKGGGVDYTEEDLLAIDPFVGIDMDAYAPRGLAEFMPAAREMAEQGLAQETEAQDRFREYLEQSVDPNEIRRRAQLQGLFSTLANPNKDPLKAFMQGLSGTGMRLTEAEKEAQEAEGRKFQGLSQLERQANAAKTALFNAQTALARAEQQGANEQTKQQLELAVQRRKLQVEMIEGKLDRESRENAANAAARAAVEQRATEDQEIQRAREGKNLYDAALERYNKTNPSGLTRARQNPSGSEYRAMRNALINNITRSGQPLEVVQNALELLNTNYPETPAPESASGGTDGQRRLRLPDYTPN